MQNGGSWRLACVVGPMLANSFASMRSHPIELWTGKQICSVLVCPNDTKTEDGRETEAMCANDGSYFCKSEMLSGHLGKGTLGSGNKDGLLSVLHREYKTHAAASCMDRVARMRRPERLVGSDFSADIHDLDNECGTTNLAYSNGVCTFVYVDSRLTSEKDPVQYRDRAFK